MFIPIFPMVWFFPYYIKKEDAKDVLRFKKLTLVFVSIGLAIVIGIMLLFVYPKLNGLYTEFNFQKPLITEIAPYVGGLIAIGLVMFSSYIYFSSALDKEFETRLAKYKDGEMIKTRELVGTGHEWKLFVLIALCIGFLVAAIILPIYNITSSIQ